MSSSPPNYTDGVPVKISERYKPPPEIHLPSKLLNQLSRTQVPVAFDFDDYNFDLERKVLSKTTEWINYRLNEKSERQQRIHERDLLRQKRIEVEQKEKLNQVSYPSADELTSSCDEEDEPVAENIPEKNPFSPNFNSNTILMPTQAMPSTSVINRKSHRRYASNSSNKIDFSFFESDTSPFDHLEMKSMNEMEVLAQILKSTAVESDESALERNNSSESENSEPRSNNNNNVDVEHPPVTAAQAIQEQPYQQPNYNTSMYNNYYNYPTTAGGGTQYYGNANYSTPTHQQHSQFASNLYPANNFYYTQNYAVNYNHVGGVNNNATPVTTTMENYLNSDKTENSSKSKSVPDIVKELNDELNNSERRRIRNYSQNSHKVEEHEEAKETKSPEKELKKLPVKSQAMAKQICQMGFNEDMVVRVLMRIGDNDKKIVEHLIVLSELLQMGFAEEKISEALLKFDNNKDEALDFLIS